MWRFKTVRIADNQRAIWHRDGSFQGVLQPGTYRFWRRARHTAVQVYASDEVAFANQDLRYLVKAHRAALAPHAMLVETTDREVALLRINGVARQLLLPGSVSAFWTHVHDVSVERLDVTADLAVPDSWLQAMRQAGERMDVASQRKLVQAVEVDNGHEAILMVDGAVIHVLQPGRYAFWRVGQDVRVLSVDKRVQSLEVNGQEILTKDRVSLRINAALQYRVEAAVTAAVEVPDVQELAYRAVQFALRRAVGAITLDELLANKAALGSEVQADVATQVAALGLTAQMVGIKDVILPGEMKDILNQVVEAEKQAEANAVRRRDESANVRALANTARMLEGNPMMARLKELEALQQITSQVNNLHVMNGLDGVLNKLITVQTD